MSKSWEGTWGSLSMELSKLAGDEIKREILLVFAVRAVFHNADGDLPISFASWVFLVENVGLVQVFKKLAGIWGGQCKAMSCVTALGCADPAPLWAVSCSMCCESVPTSALCRRRSWALVSCWGSVQLISSLEAALSLLRQCSLIWDKAVWAREVFLLFCTSERWVM